MRKFNRAILLRLKELYFTTWLLFVVVAIFLLGSLFGFILPRPAYGWVWNDVLVSGGALDQIHPQVAYAGGGNLMIVWENRDSGSGDIYGLIQAGGQSGSPFPICTAQGDQRYPQVVWNGSNYFVVWEDTRGGNADIYGSRVSVTGTTGTVLDNPPSSSGGGGGGVPLCSASGDQLQPSLVWNSQDRQYLIVWQDHRIEPAKIYGLRLTEGMQSLDGPASSGGLLIARSGGTNPSVAWNGANYLVVWEYQTSASSCDIYGGRVSSSGQVIDDAPLLISGGEGLRYNPAVASDGRDFLVIWDIHPQNEYSDVAGMLVSADGLPDSRGEFPIAEYQWNQLNPSVIWCENHYLVAWKDTRNGKVDIYFVRLSSAGSFLDSQTKFSAINACIVGSSLLDSPVAIARRTDSGEYVIIWEEVGSPPTRSNTFDIYSQRYQATAPPVLSWTGEANYQNSGVNPAIGPAGTSFEFRVKYSSLGNLPPQKAQVWIDQDDDGVYSINPANSLMDKIINLTPEPGNNYIQGVIYKAMTTLELAGDGKLNYRFVFSDGTNEATGEPAKSHQILVGNSPASLEWMGTDGYESDGVNPNSAPGGTTFTFMVRYRDLENDPPSVAEVWVDLNRDNNYDQDEKFPMQAVNTQSFSAGRGYQKSISCLYLPDSTTSAGAINIKYRFNFTSGHTPIGGEPSSDHFFSLTPYRSVPVLSWVSEAGFVQGVRLKGSEAGGGSYEFQVCYQDQDNDPALIREVWIDENADGTFSQEEKHIMEELTSSDTVVSDGKIYRLLIDLSSSAAGDEIRYRFVFSDGKNIATGEPFLTLAKLPASLSVYLTWTGQPGYTQDGVNPDSGPAQSLFQFQVRYVNEHDFPPKIKKLWIDLNNDGQYQGGELYDLEELDPLDMDYGDGKIYTKSVSITPQLTLPANLNYRFIFQDIYSEEAAGEPAQGLRTVLILATTDAPLDPNTTNQQPQDPNQPTKPGDVPPPSSSNDVPREIKSTQGGCFIRSLLF